MPVAVPRDIMTEQQMDDEYNAGYDIRSYVMKYGWPNRKKGMHLTDEFKLPRHITFSNESVYHSPATPGGRWSSEDGVWHFYASPYNVKVHSADKLRDYFNRFERGSVLHLPRE